MRHRIEYLLVSAMAFGVRVTPRPLARVAGTFVGYTFFVLDGVHRQITLDNLASAFPRRPMKERRGIARHVFAHFGRLLFELLKFSTISHGRMLRLVDVEGGERVRQAYAQGKGVLFFTGHFGYWEIHAIAHALKFQPIGVLARPLDNPYLNAFLERVRSCTGNTVIYRRSAIRRVLRALDAGQGVALLIDQHILTPEAVYVDFFERPAATTSALAAIALRTGAPVVPVFAVPIEGGRYRLIYDHPIEPPRAESPDPVGELTQRCTDVLEMYVRRYPGLWLWMHRRWRDGTSSDRIPGMFPAASRDAEADA
ncbi:MAG: lysophospholipid acyltransferase family protein [Acidobacteria bacterium]|nr:lysophospholipid acyltransferase family protein [Acidobacteriota bacterium]